MEKKCRGWHETSYAPTWSAKADTELTAVDYLPAAKSVWAAGGYKQGAVSGGILLQLGKTSPAIQKGTHAFSDIHYGMAVGPKGQVYHYSSGTWNQLLLPAGNVDSLGVWGATINSKETFLLSGKETSTTAGVLACSVSGTTMTCSIHTGFSSGTVLGPIFGTVASAALGPAWVLEVDSSGNEDIYYHGSSSTKWSASVPQGCVDKGSTGGTPCSKTLSHFTDLYGSSTSDLWAVGSYGSILRYDGSKWSAVTKAISNQSTYSMDAVYSSGKEKLVIIAMHNSSTAGNAVQVITYNRALNRWFGPLLIHPPSNKNTSDQIMGIGGAGYSDLWMVGRRKVFASTGTSSQMKGWILQLK